MTTRMQQFIGALTLSLLTLSLSHAAVSELSLRLPQIFADSMVLQRDCPVPVWGWARPASRITATFAGQDKSTTASPDGTWRIQLDPMPASTQGRELKIVSDDNPADAVTIADVLVGDVWLCAGQSNMERTVPSSLDAQQDIARADYPAIRHVRIRKRANIHPLDDVERDGKWLPCSPRTVGAFTAVGYFFGEKLHSALGIPIGLVNVSWSGSAIEPWIPREAYENTPALVQYLNRIDQWDSTSDKGAPLFQHDVSALSNWLDDAKQARRTGRGIAQLPPLEILGNEVNGPTHYYNGMIHGLIPYPIRGAIWYQGESNSGDGLGYFPKLKALIEGWRAAWGEKDFPFYVVQLPNYGSDNRNPEGGDGWARIREAERKVLELPATGLAVTIDVGDAGNLHPPDKQDVGRRLALWALADTYEQDLVGSGPLYREMKIEGNAIRIVFDYVGSGLIVGEKNGLAPVKELPGGTLQRFSIAGEDRVWHWARAVIEGDTVLVSSDAIPQPVAVRYAFSAAPEGANLYNREGLPASPFQTDGPAAGLAKQKARIRQAREETYATVFKIPPEWEALRNPSPQLLTNWLFRMDPRDTGVSETWYAAAFDRTAWTPIDVPSFWSESDAGEYEGYAWYRTSFDVPAGWKEKAVRLLFGSVDEEAWIYINGKPVGEHTMQSTELPLGTIWETPFVIDVPTALLRFDGKNALVVRVRNQRVSGGIWRPVLLHSGDAR